MATQTITLRAATPQDTGALDRLLSRSYPRLLKADYPPSVMVTAVPLIARANPRLLASGTYYVAETSEGEIVGGGGWTPSGRRGVAAEVRHVVTDERHLRRGIGRRIMMGVFAEAGYAGVRWLHCQSTLTAAPFYRALGFREIGPAVVPLRPGIDFPIVRFVREL